MFDVNGIASIIAQILRAPKVTEHGDRYDATEREFWNRMMPIWQTQNSTQEFGARKTVGLRLRKNRHVGSEILTVGRDMADFCTMGRTAMVENLGSAFKHA